MILNYDQTRNEKILRCVKRANDILEDLDFYGEIAQKNSFDMSTASPTYIAKKMREKFPKLNCNVKTYYKKWSRANAFFEPSNPTFININLAKLNRTDESIVATIIHEWVHMVDGVDKQESFGHGSNSSKGKQNTAPYWIDNLAESFSNRDKSVAPDFNNNESRKIYIKLGFWGTIKRFFQSLI
jgi:hypothetical protein